MEKTSSRVIEEIRVKWDNDADPKGHNPGYKCGTDQNGRTIEVNRNLDQNIGHGTIHIDRKLFYDGAPSPLDFLKRYPGLQSFVIVEA